MPANNHWSEERWDRLITRWCADFGPDAAAKMIESTISECGGERITFPSLKDLQRRDRDRRICNYHRGNYEETAARFGVHVNTARRVVLRQRIIDRSNGREKIND